MKVSEQKKLLQGLFDSQMLAVLASNSDGHPYTNLMAFAATKNLKTIIFATTRSTRKYANLSADSRASILVDNRSNKDADFHKGIAVTITGRTSEVDSRSKKRLLKLYIAKHPHLEDFVTAPTCALIRMTVDTYYIVSRFQNVIELHMKK